MPDIYLQKIYFQPIQDQANHSALQTCTSISSVLMYNFKGFMTMRIKGQFDLDFIGNEKITY